MDTTTTNPTQKTERRKPEETLAKPSGTGESPSAASSETNWRKTPAAERDVSSPAKKKTGKNGPAKKPKTVAGKGAETARGMSTGKKVAAAAGVAAAAAAGVAAVKGLKGSKSKNVFVIERGEDGWELHREDGNGSPQTFDTKQEALQAGRKEAKRHQPSELVVHRADGTVQDRFSLGD